MFEQRVSLLAERLRGNVESVAFASAVPVTDVQHRALAARLEPQVEQTRQAVYALTLLWLADLDAGVDLPAVDLSALTPPDLVGEIREVLRVGHEPGVTVDPGIDVGTPRVTLQRNEGGGLPALGRTIPVTGSNRNDLVVRRRFADVLGAAGEKLARDAARDTTMESVRSYNDQVIASLGGRDQARELLPATPGAAPVEDAGAGDEEPPRGDGLTRRRGRARRRRDPANVSRLVRERLSPQLPPPANDRERRRRLEQRWLRSRNAARERARQQRRIEESAKDTRVREWHAMQEQRLQELARLHGVSAEALRNLHRGDKINGKTLVGWARKTAADPCSFCALMASRGPVFPSRYNGLFTQKGGITASFHKNCRCTVIPVVKRDDWGEFEESRLLNEKFAAIWYSTRNMKAFREKYYETFPGAAK